MSKISILIFNDPECEKHYITSPYGARNTISTSAGKTSSFHNGTDYGTNGKKLPQYAIEDGYVFAAQTASDGAKYVWVIYPRIKLAFLHYHLDTISVKAGQKVTKGTKLGTTGKTGKATGIHLHLGIRPLTNLTAAQVKAMTWALLRSCAYTDPEKVNYTAPSVAVSKNKYETGTYTVTADLLNVRTGAGTSYAKKTFKQLTANAQAQIKKLNNGKEANGLVKGCVCTVSVVKGNWGKIPSGWICLDYCKRV